MARIARLFVPLDVEFATDPKILQAGPAAAYLYVCSLAYAKRAGTEGHIHANQLQVVAIGQKGAANLAATLTAAGLWERTETGWLITAWHRHNLSGDQLVERKQTQRTRAIAANHARHHLARGVTSPDCELCQTGPNRDEERSLYGDGMVPRDRESRGRVEGEGEGEGEGNKSSSVSSPQGPAPTTTDHRITEAINRHATQQATGKHKPNAYAATVRANALYEHGTRLVRYLTAHPDATTTDVYLALTTDPEPAPPTTSRAPAWYANPDCEHCPGEGLCNVAPEGTPATYAPCPCRAPNPYPDKLATVTHMEPRTA